MKLSGAQLNEIEELAGLFFSVKEVAMIIGISPISLKNEVERVDSPAYEYYHRGRLKKEAELRRTVMTMAKQGSTPALNQALSLWQELAIKNL